MVLAGATERWSRLNSLHSAPEQSSEPGSGDSSSHRQRLHEEERKSECGGGPDQAGNQAQR